MSILENEKESDKELELIDLNMQAMARTKLAEWVIDKVSSWERWRDQNYKDKWAEYYRLWRGMWNETDKTRESERSKIVTPALMQAIEAAVAEQEEAVFSSSNWFDIADDYTDKEKGDVTILRNLLLEDMEWNDVPAAMSEIFLMAAIYGTGIGKIITEEKPKKRIININKGGNRIDAVQEVPYVACALEPVSPENFVIDPTVTKSGTMGISEALGVAHIVVKPKYSVVDKQRNGTYFNVDVGSMLKEDMDASIKGESTFDKMEDKTKIVEYYGMVPKELFDLAYKNSKELPEDEEDEYEDGFVEAVITIANDSVLLRVEKNEFIMGDRPFVAYSFEKIPNRFFGRGIAEKGYNAQKSLDAMHRAQLDGLALSVHPMIAVDSTKIARGIQYKVSPGRTLHVTGDPNAAIKEFRFPGIDPTSYNATSDLERYIQMGTGSMDSSTPLRSNRRNETVGGMSMIMGGVMKRSKRILLNIERNFIIPLIEKMMWRYFQFAPERYVPQDFKFKVVGGLGMMAREVETQQMVNLLGFVPPESPAFFAIVGGIIENTSIKNKQEVLAAVAKGMQPNPQEQQAQQAAMQQEMQKKQAQTAEIGSRIQYRQAQTQKIAEQSMMDKLKLIGDLSGRTGKT